MLEIYYGDAKYKNRLCAGAAIRAAIKQKNVLFVSFMSVDPQSDKLLCSREPNIILMQPDMPVTPEELSDEKRAQLSRVIREFFDKAIRMALTFKYQVLLLDRIFDVISADLLSSSEVYEFLSDAPDMLEIICTGHEPEQRFLALADESIMVTETHVE